MENLCRLGQVCRCEWGRKVGGRREFSWRRRSVEEEGSSRIIERMSSIFILGVFLNSPPFGRSVFYRVGIHGRCCVKKKGGRQ